MKQLRELFFTSMLFLCTIFPASADANSRTVYFSSDDDVLIYSGNISAGAVKRVKDLYKVHKFKILSITSNGGEYDSGMELAKFVYDKNLSVYVPQYCASACTFAFFGVSSKNRDIAPTALLGLHNISFSIVGADPGNIKVTVDEAMEFAQIAVVRSGTMLSLYAANGIPADVLYKVSKSYGSTVVNVQRGDLQRWGVIQKK